MPGFVALFMEAGGASHHRSRGATGSHPSGTPVARRSATGAPATFSRERKKGHFRSARTNPLCPWIRWVFLEAGGAGLSPVARRDRFSSVSGTPVARQRATSAPATFSRERKKGHFRSARTNPLCPWIRWVFFGGGWRSTAGREARPAHPFGTPVARQRATGAKKPPSPRAEEGTHFRSARTNPLCRWIRWVFLEAGDHRSRGATGFIRSARRSRDKSDQRASHLLPRTEEGTDWGEENASASHRSRDGTRDGNWCDRSMVRWPPPRPSTRPDVRFSSGSLPNTRSQMRLVTPKIWFGAFRKVLMYARWRVRIRSSSGAKRPREMNPVVEQLVGKKSRDQPEPYRGRRRHSKDAEDQRR